MNRLNDEELPQPKNPNFESIRQDLLGEQGFKDTISKGADLHKIITPRKESRLSEKTMCTDEESCVALNEFLDYGYRPQDSVNFAMDSGKNYATVTFDTSTLGPRDKMELTLRLMKFVTAEIEKIKNGY